MKNMKFEELVRSYAPVLLKKFMHDNWHIIEGISNFLESEQEESKKGRPKITPRIELLLSAFHLVSFDPYGLLPNSLKVVFLFQDPYPTPNLACGVATCTLNGYPQLTLTNIFKRLSETYRIPYQAVDKIKEKVQGEDGKEVEIEKEIAVTKYKDMPPLVGGDIRGWCTQGILMWNTALTTREHEMEAHISEWSLFTDQMIKWMSDTFPFLIFVCLGKKAQLYQKHINASKHIVLASSHPAGRGYNYGFNKCDIFNEINTELKKNLREPIQWEDYKYV